jgi:hypothetical protein
MLVNSKHIPIPCTLVNGIRETSVNSTHYANSVYPCQWNLEDVHEFKHYANSLYPCQWTLEDVREFKTVSKFLVPLSMESGRRPLIPCTLVSGIWKTSMNSNIKQIPCTLVNGLWKTSVNSKHYTYSAYPCQWNLDDVRKFKTLRKFRAQ